MGKSLDPTIVLFAKLPVPGGAKTRLGRVVGGGRAARMAAAMLIDRLRMVSEQIPDEGAEKLLCGDREVAALFLPYLSRALGKNLSANRMKSGQSGFPGWGWDYRSQGGGTLGERILRVLRDCRKGGCILIGSDAVGQTGAALKAALSAQRRGRSVVQPAHDGGFTLLALPAGDPPEGWGALADALKPTSQSDFNSQSISWRELATAVEKCGWEADFLGPERDIDEWSDVESLLTGCADSGKKISVMPEFLQELSNLPKDVWSVSVEMPILRAGETAPTVPAEKE